MAGRRRPGRLLRAVVGLGVLGQLPMVALVAAAFGWRLSLALAAAVSTPFFARLGRGVISDEDERGARALAQLAFYAWWGGSLVVLFAWPAASLVARASGATARTAQLAALALGAGAGLLGVSVNRVVVRLRQVIAPLPALPASLDGYRIAHLSDLHVGGHTPPERLRAWVDRVNAAEVDLAVVTGDLITMGVRHLAAVARELGRLRARDGAFVCLGNHDYFGDSERLVALLEGAGVPVLRNQGRVVRSPRTGASFYLAGVEDTWTGRADVEATLAGRPAGLPAIVLAHDPALFDACAALGADLVLSGHTHGGQVALPGLARFVNPARLAYRYTAGLYRRGRSVLYVSRGAGTTGPPLRIGAPSEIALLTLRAPVALSRAG